ncbi:crotonase/enoyl-CoA hydratase family protein [Actinoallomurus sp. CA-142502]|uniref:crotonase/enoyl-CoA hydratase family protein n=1 Tax=Actinoallomurus sp. CA-142502 TaxID=3239885 RepID=UPI003D915848
MIRVERAGAVTTVVIDRPEVRNAVDPEHAAELYAAFTAFDADPEASVAVLYGEGGTFCAGADLKAVSAGRFDVAAPEESDRGPMGPTRLRLSKPVVAAVAGHAVAGGLELALWCDLRVAEEDAIFGVFCRRWGVPLIDGGTVRLPRLIGLSAAMDMILTGRPVGAQEASRLGLANRLVPAGQARERAEELAAEIARFPQLCMRHDRLSAYEQAGLPVETAMANEWRHGEVALDAEARQGATRFAKGSGRHGDFDAI